MQTLPFLLVLISIFTHAYWNFLIKSSDNKHVFTGLSKVMEILIFCLPAAYFMWNYHFELHFVVLIVGAAFITFLNYLFLSNAYKHGELSMVYPVSRSSILFLPLLGFIFINESISLIGYISIALILIGTFVMHIDTNQKKPIQYLLSNLKNKGTVYSILAALAVAGYTIWDKVSITKMQPFLYFYLYTAVIALFYGIFIISTYTKEAISKEWTKNKFRIVQVGFFNSFTYILVLTALGMSQASYVGGLRQLSIVIGAFLGYKFLNEKLSFPKIVGIVISVMGGGLIYLA